MPAAGERGGGQGVVGSDLVAAVFAAPEGQAGKYSMAAGMDPNLATLIDSTMAGERADAAQERKLKESGWR